MEPSREQFFRSFRPVLLPLFLTGCLSFRVNRTQDIEISLFTKIYTNLIRPTILGCMIFGWALKIVSHQFSQHLRELSPLIKFLGFTEMLITSTTYFSVSTVLALRRDLHVQFYEEAYELDRLFIKEFNVNFNYQKTIRKNNIYMTSLLMYIGVYYFIYMLYLDSDWRVLLIALGYTLCTIGPGSSSYGHISVMDYFRIRFRLFQKLFKKLFRLNLKAEEQQRQKILSLIRHYQKYCGLIHGVNNVYGNAAIANYFHDFTQTSSMVFVLCHKASESNTKVVEYIALFMFVLPRVIKVIYTSVYSRLTVKENEACFQMIATYDNHYPSKEIKQSIGDFLLWKKHNTFRFTIGKALTSNFGLAYSFFSGIANYILILIQLKLQEASIEDRLKLNTHKAIVEVKIN